IYFYVLKLTRTEYKFGRKDLLHFIPALSEPFILASPILPFLTFISVITYLYSAHRLIERFYKRQEFTSGDRYRVQLRWLHKLLKGLGLLWLLWIPFTVIGYYYHFGAHAYYPFYLAMAAMLICIAVSAYLRPEVSASADNKQVSKPQIPADLKQKGAWLKNIVKVNLYYQDPELSLVSLAEKLGLTTHELSRIINQGLKKSFNDFINEYRVAEVKRKMQNPAYDHITLLGIAYDSGFNSKSTFNLIFKKITGNTPAEYKAGLKKEFLSYNLGRHDQWAMIISNHETTPKWSREKLNRNYMFRNYLKVALRNLVNQKILTFINVFGLSVGLACFILFLLYAVNELSFDSFHKNGKDIYRVYEYTKGVGGSSGNNVSTAMPLGPAMQKDLPEVLNYVRIKQLPIESFVRSNDGRLRGLHITFSDPQIFSVFTFPLKYGNPSTALKELNDLVLTESKAKEWFGTADVTGRTVQIKFGDNFLPFIITAVAKDVPANSSIRFDVLGNFAFFQATPIGTQLNAWYVTAFRTYIQLRPGSKLPYDAQRLALFHQRYNPVEKMQAKAPQITYGLQPIRSIHTNTELSDESVVESVDPKTIWIILSIAAGIMIIACINFTTLAVGRSAGRGKEVGVRKVIGAARGQLISQFLSEALMLSIISTSLGLLLAVIFLPYFNQLSGRDLQFSFSLYPAMIWLLVVLILLVSLLSGSYPALILSRFNPLEVLKNKLRMGGSNLFTRSLVVFQFVLSICLIIATVIILQQTRYMVSKNPGFDKENVVMVDVSQIDIKKVYPIFKQAVLTQPGITGVASAGAGFGKGTDIETHGFKYQGVHKSVYEYSIDPDYIKVLGMKLVAGRNFDPTIADDTTNSVIINEAMVNDFGWTLNNAIGQRIKGYTDKKAPVVIGVVKNFNFQPLRENIQPQLFHNFAGSLPQKLFIRIKPGNIAPTLSGLQQIWSKVVPGVPFEYTFVDENLNNFYKAEQRWSSVVGWAAGISIFLACMGLFGLAALAAVNRSKEIGIRKVLGAPVLTISGLLTKDFLKLVIIALLIASPVVWYLMNRWLQSYTYRVNISVWVFALTGLGAIAIACITVGFQAFKAALANPVKSLRSE
ncbi:MAG: ABC transporter permease, partial [Bacteroidetes bacterium]|nr:ABC transporter permease [Bacteroidota bacterium]